MDGNLRTYTHSISAYVNDNFGGRVPAVRLRNKLSFKLGMGSDLVIQGRTPGWYFFDEIVVWESYQGRMVFDDKDVEKWVRSVARLQKKVTNEGAVFAAIIPPDKARIYSEHAPSQYGLPGTNRFISSLYAHPDSRASGLLNVEKHMFDAKQNGLVYFRTDTHWTHRGAYQAYLKVMDGFSQSGGSFPVIREVKLIRENIREFSGDLVNLLGLSGTITEALDDIHPPKPKLGFSETTEEDTALERDGWRTLVQSNGKENGTTLIIIGDSFSHKMMPFFQHSFDKIVLMHHRNGDFDVETALAYQPDAVLFAPVERSAITLKDF